eukprot:3937343-Amphidinium_carterae.1
MRIAYLSLDRPDLAHAVPSQPQVPREHVPQADVARQGHCSGRHGLCWSPNYKEEHYRCSNFHRVSLRENPEQLADDGEPASPREKWSTTASLKRLPWAS